MKRSKMLLSTSTFILAIAGTFAGRPKSANLLLFTGWYAVPPVYCENSHVSCTTTGNGQVCKYDPGLGGPKITLEFTATNWPYCNQQALFTLNPQ